MLSVVLAVVAAPWRKTREVEVTFGATEKLEPEKRKFEVELVKVKATLEVAPPPSCPKSTCESTPAERNVSEPPAVEVTYLLPLKSRMLVTAVKVPIVDDGLRNSDEDATPVGPIVKRLTPVEEEMVRRLAVWFATPWSWSVVVPTLAEMMWSVDEGFAMPMPILPPIKIAA